MAIPDFQTMMLPMLKVLGDEQDHPLREMYVSLAASLQLTDEDRRELLPSGKQPIFNNRVGWATTHLKKAGLIESPQRAFFKITARGKETLGKNPSRIDIKFLNQFEEFREFRSRPSGGTSGGGINPPIAPIGGDDITPEEALENAHENLRNALASELLQTIKENPPSLFEKLSSNCL